MPEAALDTKQEWNGSAGMDGSAGIEGGQKVARVLILGGTAEARALATALTALPGVQPISSLAGRVADPALPPGEVRIGGFGGVAGLTSWLATERITAVVDATHPFAATISWSAAESAAASGVPILALRRPGWSQRPGDDWRWQPSLAAAAASLAAAPEGSVERVFLTIGRTELAPFAGLDRHWFLIRSIQAPQPPLPARHEVLLARGPFTVQGEIELMREHQIEVLVTKDSGGRLTEAKLVAARELRLPVLLVERPPVPDVPAVSNVEQARNWVAALVGPSAQPG
jgi:precorrin-6A/cobalt-precorrin-6A reductase